MGAITIPNGDRMMQRRSFLGRLAFGAAALGAGVALPAVATSAALAQKREPIPPGAPPREAPRYLQRDDEWGEHVAKVYVDGVDTKDVLAYDMDAGFVLVYDMLRKAEQPLGDHRTPMVVRYGVVTVDWRPPRVVAAA